MHKNAKRIMPTKKVPIYAKTLEAVKIFLDKLKTFEIDKEISKWWGNESATAKVAFFSALIIGFVSHIFIYTNRYFGEEDAGRIWHAQPAHWLGRWFNATMNNLNYGYVIPLTSGIFVTLFLAISAFYVCKLFNISKKVSAVSIGALLATFPSIANTNLFLYETADYHLGAPLAVLAVYITVKYKFGFVVGGILSMLTLAIYQSKYNIVVVLCLFYLIFELLNNVNFKRITSIIIKFLLLALFGGTFYIVSLKINSHFFGHELIGYRGLDLGNIQGKLFSFSGISASLEKVYRGFYDGFFGNIYVVTDGLKYAYIIIAGLSALFLCMIIMKQKIYKQPVRLLMILALLALTPLASNFASFFDTGNLMGLVIYSFVMVLMFSIVISEQSTVVYPVVKSIFIVCVFFVVANYVVENNVYYLRAHYANQRIFSITTRILARVDPLLPMTDSREITFFGRLPNEHYQIGAQGPSEFENIQDHRSLRNYFLHLGRPGDYEQTLLAYNISNVHGLEFKQLNYGERRDQIAQIVLDTNMPIWPAEGSVDIINDVIVVNFGL